MDSRYIKRLFGDNYHGFNEIEAIENVGVSFLDFLTRIQNVGGKPKISTDIDLEAIYTFTLFCYYHWCAHSCKVLIVPDFFDYLQLMLGFSQVDKIEVTGKPIKKGEKQRVPKRGSSVMFTSNQTINIPKLFVDCMKNPDVLRNTVNNFFASFDLSLAEPRNIKEFLDQRTISSKLATKLSKLFVCLFGDDNETPQRRKDIMNILSAFNLTHLTKHSDLLDNYKQLYRKDVAPLYLLSQKRVYLNSGNDKNLLEYSKDLESEIVNYILNQKESIR
jgi:hypothetical protein